MSTDENKAFARRCYEATSSGNPDALNEVFAPDYVDHNPGLGQAPGLEGFKQASAIFRRGIPDTRVTVEDLIAEGDKVVARLIVRGTHTGEFAGIPPTGKQVTMTGIDIIRIANGKVVERWGEFDILGLMQQLGAIPAPGQAGS